MAQCLWPNYFRLHLAALIKQVTQGHNIDADGWAGASNLNPHHKSPTHMHKKHLKRSFPHFSTRVHGPTDQPTNQRTDKASYRVACPQLQRFPNTGSGVIDGATPPRLQSRNVTPGKIGVGSSNHHHPFTPSHVSNAIGVNNRSFSDSGEFSICHSQKDKQVFGFRWRVTFLSTICVGLRVRGCVGFRVRGNVGFRVRGCWV